MLWFYSGSHSVVSNVHSVVSNVHSVVSNVHSVVSNVHKAVHSGASWSCVPHLRGHASRPCALPQCALPQSGDPSIRVSAPRCQNCVIHSTRCIPAYLLKSQKKSDQLWLVAFSDD